MVSKKTKRRYTRSVKFEDSLKVYEGAMKG
jgi:hypothetical protein